jgi:hypothetical protein
VACGGRTLRESARRGEGDGPDGQVPHEVRVRGEWPGWAGKEDGPAGGVWAGKKRKRERGWASRAEMV